MIVLLALALQAAHPLLEDPAFVAAHRAWAACTDRVVDAEAPSARSVEAIVAAALAACPDEQEATRRAVAAFSGDGPAREQMATILAGNREGLAGRVRERRRQAAARSGAGAQPGERQAHEAAALAWAQCSKRHVDAALAARARRGDIIDAAFAACTGEEAATRAIVVRMLGSETAADRMMTEARTIARDSMRAYLRRQRR